MLNKPDFPLRVFYDGSCVVCAAEIEHYLRLDQRGSLQGIDIHAADFDPAPFNISLALFMYELHAIDNSQRVYRGVEAFWAIWQAFPASTLYGGLAAVVTAPLVKPLARLLYKGFARIRPYLPKKQSCSSGRCRISEKNSDGD